MTNATVSSDVASPEGSDCGTLDFTKEAVDALLNERVKMKKFDHKGNLELVSELNNRLKVCLKWFQIEEEAHVEEEGLQLGKCQRIRFPLDEIWG